MTDTKPDITFLFANPLGDSDADAVLIPSPRLDQDKELEHIVPPDRIEGIPPLSYLVIQGCRVRDFCLSLIDRPSTLIHLSCHGETNTLLLEGSHSSSERYTMDDFKRELVNAFGSLDISEEGDTLNEEEEGASKSPGDQPPTIRTQLLVLNVCHSYETAQFLHKYLGVRHIIATKGVVNDIAAIAFFSHFYPALYSGQSIADAFLHARKQIGYDSRFGRYFKSNEFFVLYPDEPTTPQEHHRRVIFLPGINPNLQASQRIYTNTHTPTLPIITLHNPVGVQKRLYTIFNAIFDQQQDIKTRLLVIQGDMGLGKATSALLFARYLGEREYYNFSEIEIMTVPEMNASDAEDEYKSMLGYITKKVENWQKNIKAPPQNPVVHVMSSARTYRMLFVINRVRAIAKRLTDGITQLLKDRLYANVFFILTTEPPSLIINPNTPTIWLPLLTSREAARLLKAYCAEAINIGNLALATNNPPDPPLGVDINEYTLTMLTALVENRKIPTTPAIVIRIANDFTRTRDLEDIRSPVLVTGSPGFGSPFSPGALPGARSNAHGALLSPKTMGPKVPNFGSINPGITMAQLTPQPHASTFPTHATNNSNTMPRDQLSMDASSRQPLPVFKSLNPLVNVSANDLPGRFQTEFKNTTKLDLQPKDLRHIKSVASSLTKVPTGDLLDHMYGAMMFCAKASSLYERNHIVFRSEGDIHRYLEKVANNPVNKENNLKIYAISFSFEEVKQLDDIKTQIGEEFNPSKAPEPLYSVVNITRLDAKTATVRKTQVYFPREGVPVYARIKKVWIKHSRFEDLLKESIFSKYQPLKFS